MLSCDGRHCICYLYANALPGRPCKLPGQANISCASRLPGTHLQRTEGVVVLTTWQHRTGTWWPEGPALSQTCPDVSRTPEHTLKSKKLCLEQNIIPGWPSLYKSKKLCWSKTSSWNDHLCKDHNHKKDLTTKSTAGHTQGRHFSSSSLS